MNPLIDPEQRHDLGEYYTPDWLAHRICHYAIDDPVRQRVLDPSCGSGTFLFHSVRRYLDEAERDRIPNKEALSGCVSKVFGTDIHPVAVQIARVTYLLAMGEERLRDRPELGIPVYLGDALQWNTKSFLADSEVFIEVPNDGAILHFPLGLSHRPEEFDRVISKMLELSERGASPEEFEAWLIAQPGFDAKDAEPLRGTYDDLARLQREGKDHIWGFVARNLVRPAWLSQEDERPDVIVGNPPWLSYRYMTGTMQTEFKQRCQEKRIWEGGKVATHQDLAAYFLARCCELYFKRTTRLAFVMPYAVMSRQQYAGFRKGWFGESKPKKGSSVGKLVVIKFDEAWAFPDLQPLFPVPSCVLFCSLRGIDSAASVLPALVRVGQGALPRRDASHWEADAHIVWSDAAWPESDDTKSGSTYRSGFRQGATMVPRMLCTVIESPTGILGAHPTAPLVESRRSAQEKKPWKDLPSLRFNVEREFVRDLYLGESIAPFRLLEPVKAIIPVEGNPATMLDSKSALARGHTHLAKWMTEAEERWHRFGNSSVTFSGQLDYYGKLTAQFPVATIRVLYSASGSNPTAAILEDSEAVIEHKLYWTPASSLGEARFLCAIINCSLLPSLIGHLQSRGQWGARDIDKVMFSLPIPKFEAAEPLHVELARLAAEAENVAQSVASGPTENFIKTRGRIRAALIESDISSRIDDAVRKLLRLGGE